MNLTIKWYYFVLGFAIVSPVTTFATIVYLQPVQIVEPTRPCVVRFQANNEEHEYYGISSIREKR